MSAPPSPPITVAAFYKFARLDGLEQLRDRLHQFCTEQEIVGTILLAAEGINATVAGPDISIQRLLDHLNRDQRLADIKVKRSLASEVPFHRLKVKVKAEIVTMGVTGLDPAQNTGVHVDAQKWNQLLQDPDVITIDTRNDYEYHIGTFQSAISPETKNFREFPQFVEQNLDPQQHRKIAMFCTGGIRCEKASAYLLDQGFEEVYQLDGGILNYLEQQPEGESLWQGECFVFDGRVAVNHDLEAGSHIMCYGCRRPLSAGDCASDRYEAGVSCPHCYDDLTEEQTASFRERWRQEVMAQQRQQKHVGGVMPRSSDSPQ
ncbi:MAG: rhodanese-related sulfurtransferase [Cyanobacteria bacterium P01_A01_bin.3]